MHIVYSPRYNITLGGIEKFHPFDASKYGRAWALLKQEFGPALKRYHREVDNPATDEELSLVHSQTYLASLRSSAVLARALELPFVRFVPAWLLHQRIVKPMRWAVRGSVMAGKAALETGLAINLSGGYHHAKPGAGEGFCLFADAALIVRQLRSERLLSNTDTVLYIDLDAHQGNGVCYEFMEDRAVRIFDMYNRDIYPGDPAARARIDCDVPLPMGCPGEQYLGLLRDRLPPFMSSLPSHSKPRLVIYNAGTDPFVEDQLGGLQLSGEDILTRDLFVVAQSRLHDIPLVMLPSGGYSSQSYALIAATVAKLLHQQQAA
jgi:histone deacetylase 11